MLAKLIKILSILFVLNLNNLSTGFVAGTLVKTPNGYIPIEQLNSGDTVLTYDFKNKSIVSNEIVKVYKHRAKNIIQISLDNNDIYVCERNRFYCSLDNKKSWISAKKLSENNLFVNNSLFKFSKEFVKIDKLFKFDSSETCVYDLSIKNNHNFFVSESDILVHNEPFSISFGVFLGYEVSINLAGLAIGVAGGLVNKYILKSDKEKYRFNIPNENNWRHYTQPHHNFNGKDPKAVYNHAELFILGLNDKGELKEGVSKIYTTFEEKLLTITVYVANGLIHISNMWFQSK